MTGAALTGLESAAHKVPLSEPETDGTLAWSATTVVTVTARADGAAGLGWTYGPAAAASIVDELLGPAIRDVDAFDIPGAHLAMRRATRNAPTPGLATLAISAVDVALWDLKARLLGVPLTRLLGRAHANVPLYGSGGFVSMTDRQLTDQLSGWVADGFGAVKIKIGEDYGGHLERDLHRAQLARETIGTDTALMVDANGGYDTKEALHAAGALADLGVVWFEEPVSSDRLADLALLRSATGIEVTAGEYGTSSDYFQPLRPAPARPGLRRDSQPAARGVLRRPRHRGPRPLRRAAAGRARRDAPAGRPSWSRHEPDEITRTDEWFEPRPGVAGSDCRSIPASSESEETAMGLVLALVLIVMLLGGFYVHALWWAAPAVAAMLLAIMAARLAARLPRIRGDRLPAQRDAENVDDTRARRRRLNV